MSVRFSLRGMLRLIRVDTLRRVHSVGFLVGRLICIVIQVLAFFFRSSQIWKGRGEIVSIVFTRPKSRIEFHTHLPNADVL